MISSQCQIKIVSSLDTKFSSLEKSWYFIGVYIIKRFTVGDIELLLSVRQLTQSGPSNRKK